MNTRQKMRHLLRVFHHSKLFIVCFSIILSLLLVVGSTYAWLTDSDQRVNRTVSNTKKLSAIIVEDFERVYQWAPGTTKQKNVRVKNVGETPAFVRVSFTESFVGFDVDITDNHHAVATLVNGNGNLKVHEFDAQNETLINVNDTTTWEIGNVYSVSANKYYIANAREQDQPYIHKGNRSDLLTAFQLNFQTAKVFDTPAATVGQNNYWYYEDGYFYYSEILDPNESTPDLLESVTLIPEYANQHKGALYKLVPEMDAHDITKTLLGDWSIRTTGHVHTIYQDKLVK